MLGKLQKVWSFQGVMMYRRVLPIKINTVKIVAHNEVDDAFRQNSAEREQMIDLLNVSSLNRQRSAVNMFVNSQDTHWRLPSFTPFRKTLKE